MVQHFLDLFKVSMVFINFINDINFIICSKFLSLVYKNVTCFAIQILNPAILENSLIILQPFVTKCSWIHYANNHVSANKNKFVSSFLILIYFIYLLFCWSIVDIHYISFRHINFNSDSRFTYIMTWSPSSVSFYFYNEAPLKNSELHGSFALWLTFYFFGWHWYRQWLKFRRVKKTINESLVSSEAAGFNTCRMRVTRALLKTWDKLIEPDDVVQQKKDKHRLWSAESGQQGQILLGKKVRTEKHF